MKKMWSGRFRQALDPRFERWQRSFPFDRRLLGEELAASRAYARALQQAAVLSPEELTTILDGLGRLEEKISREPELLESTEAEDVHHFVEEQLAALVGEAGYKLHTGRSRNEQIATDLRLFTRNSIDAVRAGLADLIETVLSRAEELRGVAMPAYTHLQPAEPVLAAHWLLAYAEMFFRDADRLGDCRRRVNVLPLGSGAVAGTCVSLDRTVLACELGFAGASANSLDATGDRDFVLEFLQGLSLVALHLSRWAEEMILFSTAEFRFVELPESFATGSSALPQKKNPDLLELLRAKAGRVAGAATTVLVTLKGTPLAYNKDFQETQEPLYDAADTVREALAMADGFMRAAGFNTDRMQKAAGSGFLNATAAANYLARRGLPFRRAHAAVGQAVQLCLEKNCRLADLTLDELRGLSPEFDQDFYACLELDAVLAGHDVAGGTAPARVEVALREARERLGKLRTEHDTGA